MNIRKKQVIARRFILSVMLIIVLLVTVVTLATIWLLTGKYDNDIRTNVETTSNSIEHTTRTFIEGAYNLSYEMSVNSNLLTMDTSIQTPILEDSVMRNNYFELLYIQGMDGMQTGRSSGELADRSNRWWFHKMMELRQPFISQSYYSMATHMPSSSVFIPMYRNEEMVGIYAADIKLETLQELVERYADQENGKYSFIIDGEGVVLAHPDTSMMINITNFKTQTQTQTVTQLDNSGQVILNSDGTARTTDSHFDISNEYASMIERVMNGQSGITRFENFGKDYIAGYNSIQLPGNSDSWSVITLQDRSVAMSVISQIITVLVLAGLGVAAIGVLIVIFLTKRITAPIERLSAQMNMVAAGDLSVNLATNAQDEVGALSRDISMVVNVFTGFSSDMQKLIDAFNINGDIEHRIDTTKYNGAYKDMAESINKFSDVYVGEVLYIFELLQQICDGNFKLNIEQFPGKKVVFNQSFDNLTRNLYQINHEIEHLVQKATNGELDYKADVSNYKGDWAKLMLEINALVDAIATPLAEIEHSLTNMSVGEFTTITGEYKGAFDVLKRSVNTTQQKTLAYVEEIAEILGAISKGDLSLEITHEYLGSYAPIKSALTTILDSLNRTMGEINSAASNMLQGAAQISQSAFMLADGSSRQSASVEELNSSIEAIHERTIQNAKLAEEANSLSQKSNERAEHGNEEMNRMVSSMSSIKDASTNIAKIIKIIEDIAFQTNLLALNAAVEAARAGEHGKGFSVVAEEVRNLAAKTQKSAKETTEQIEDSVSKVSDGMSAAQGTAGSLGTIVDDVHLISDLISQIAKMSDEQKKSIEQISIGISEISAVVMSNASTSQECASASEELHSLAETMKQLVSYFKVKGY